MNLNKDPESWARVKPEVIERRHLENVLLMATQDIATLAAEVDRLRSEIGRMAIRLERAPHETRAIDAHLAGR